MGLFEDLKKYRAQKKNEEEKKKNPSITYKKPENAGSDDDPINLEERARYAPLPSHIGATKDLFDSSNYLKDQLNSNMYSVGGSEQIKKSGIINAADSIGKEAQWRKENYTENNLVNYIEDNVKYWADYLTKLSDDTTNAAEEVSALASARTGDTSWQKDDSLTKSQKAELGRMNYLAQRDAINAATKDVTRSDFDSDPEWNRFLAGMMAGDEIAIQQAVDKSGLKTNMTVPEYSANMKGVSALEQNKAAEQNRLNEFSGKNSEISAQIRSMDDFAEKSQYVPDNMYGQQHLTDMWFESGTGTYTAEDGSTFTADQYRDMAANSLIYDWVQFGNDPNMREELEFRTAQLGDAVGGYYGDILDAIPYMEDSEREEFRYLYNNGTPLDRSAAMDYLYNLDITKDYLEDKAEKQQERLANAGFLEHAGMFLESVPQSVLNMIVGTGKKLDDVGFLEGFRKWLYDKTGADYRGYDEYSLDNIWGQSSGLTRGYQGEWLAENSPDWMNIPGTDWNLAQMGYNAAASGLDMAATSLLTGGTAGVAPIVNIGGKAINMASVFSPLLMAGGSYNTQLNESLKAGRGEENAERDADVAFWAEALSELLPFDNMFNNPGASPLGKVARGAASEFIGALAGGEAQAIYDTAAYGDQSDAGQYYSELLTHGYEPNEAKWMTALKFFGLDPVGDALTEGLSAGVHTGPVAIAESIENRTSGKNIIGNEGVADLVTVAESVGLDGSNAKILADIKAALGVDEANSEITDEQIMEEAAEPIGNENVASETTNAAPVQIDTQSVIDRAMEAVSGKVNSDVSAAVESAVNEAAEFLADDAADNGGVNSDNAINNAVIVAQEALGEVDSADAEVVKNAITEAVKGSVRPQENAQSVQETAEGIAKDKGKNSKITPAKVGQLYRASMVKLDAQAQEVLSKSYARTLEGQLKNKGFEGDAKGVAKSIADAVAGKPSRAIMNLMGANEAVRSVYTEAMAKVETVASQKENIKQLASGIITKKSGAQEVSKAAEPMMADEIEIDAAEGDAPMDIVTKNAQKYLGAQAITMENMYNDTQDAAEYSEAFVRAVNYGRDGRNLDVVKETGSLSALNAQQIEAAYAIGRDARINAPTAARVNSKGISVGNVDYSGIDMSGFTPHQRKAVHTTSRLAKAIGFNIKFVESKANAQGEYTTENGSWDPRTMTLTLDVHAGSNSASDANYAMMHTMGHELTHYIKQFADGGMWNDYQAFVMDHLSTKLDNATLDDKIAKLMKNQEGLTRDGAIEEIIAESSVEALMNITDADIQQIAETNPSLLKKIGNFIQKWVKSIKAAIKAAYSGTESKTALAKAMEDQLDEMSARWNKLLVNAAQNRAAEAKGVAVAENAKTTQQTVQEVTQKPAVQKESTPEAVPLAHNHIDQRTFDSVKEEDVGLFCAEAEEAQVAYAAAAKMLLADAENSLPGEKFFTPDGEVTGQKRQTSEMLARIKDETGLTWDRIRDILQQFVDMDDAATGYMLPRNTVNNRRMELYLDEVLTEGYRTLDGTFVAPSEAYVQAKAQYEGSTNAGMDVKAPKDAVPFEEYAYADVKYDKRASFSEQIDSLVAGTFPYQDHLYVMDTPDALIQAGLEKLPILMTQKHARSVMKASGKQDANYHGFTKTGIKNIPKAIENTSLVIQSPKYNDRVIVFADMVNEKGEPVVAPIIIKGRGKWQNAEIDANVLATAYGKNNAKLMILNAIMNNEVLYVNKKRSYTLERIVGVQFSKYPSSKASNAIIRNSEPEVNTDDKKFQKRAPTDTPQTETAEFKKWFNGSKIVNADGSPKIMYHGTPYGGFTVFKDWQYFTDNPEYADVYQEPSASSIRGRYTPATNPQTYAVYLNVQKPFDTRDPKIRKIWQEEFYNNYSRTPLSEKGLPDWTDGIDLVEFIEENDYDFDAIILDEGAVGGYGDEVQSRGVSVVVRNSNQIKSATDNIGTFDPSNPDIRYSRRNISERDADSEEFSRLYDDYRAAKKELDEITQQYNEAGNDPEFIEAVMAMFNFSGSRFSAEGKTEYRRLEQAVKDIQEKLHVSELQKRKDQLEEKVKAARKAMEDFETKLAEKREAQAVEKSGLSEGDYFRKQAVKEFGYTLQFLDAGYLLPDGKMLNFSGEKGKHFGTRGQDHRAIGVIYERTSGSKALARFMNDGNIRIMSEAPGIDLASGIEPTAKQYSKIKEFVREYSDKRYFNVDISDASGKIVGNLTYEGKLNADKVINDIKHYYATGEIREQSMISQFLYQQRDLSELSDRELLVQALEGELSPEERDHLQRYKDRVDDIAKKQMQLEAINSEIVELRRNGATAKNSDELRKKMTNAKTLRASIDRVDAKLAQIESARMIQEVVKRNRAEASKKAYALARERADERQRKAVEHAREVGQRKVDRMKESQGKEKYKAQILKDVKKLHTWLTTPSMKGSVPQFLRKPVADFLESIDFTSDRALRGGEATKNDQKFADALDALRRAVGEINKQQGDIEAGAADFAGYIDLPADYMAEFDDLVGKIKTTLSMGYATEAPFNRMTADQLHELSKMFRVLNSSISKANRLIANGRYESAKAASNDTIDDMNSMRAKVKTNKALELLNSTFNWKNTTPYYAFQRLGRGGKAIFEGLQDGWDKMARNSAKLIEFAKNTFTGKESKAWGSDVSEIRLDSGDTIQMTTAQKMSLYCHTKRAQSMGHLLGGGIRISDIDTKRGGTISQVDNYVITEADIARITGSLTARQKAVADALQKFMNTVCKDWGNEISMKRFGYEQMTEDNYFPIETDANNRARIDDTKDGKNSMFRLLNMSSLKPLTPKANNAIIIRNIFDVFSNHAADMAKYNALALPILDYIKWYNYVERTDVVDASGNATGQIKTRSTQKALERAYGVNAKDYLNAFIKDLNAEHDGGRNDGLINKMIGRAKSAAVGANLRVYLLQITSLPRAAYAINPKYLAKGLLKLKSLNPMSAGGTEAQEEIGILQWKDLGFYSTDINNSVRDMVKRDGAWIDKVRDAQMAPAGWGDNWVGNIIYEAAKAEMADKHPNVQPGTNAYKTLLNRRVREIVYKTQVVDSTMTRSDFMRSKGLASMLTAFMSEPTLTVNMLNEGIQEAIMKKRGLTSEDLNPGGKITLAATVFTVNAFLTAAVEAAFDAMRDDDDYEEFFEKYRAAFGGNVLDNVNVFAMLPYLKDIISIFQGFENSSMITQGWQQLQDFKTAIEAWQEGKRPIYSVVYNGAKAASSLTGFAAGNALRDFTSIYNTVLADAWGTPKLQTYEDSKSAAANAYYTALQSGDADKLAWIQERAEVNGIAMEDISEKIGTLVKNDYEAGNITEEEAVDRLVEFSGKDADDAYWKVQEWSAGEDNYSKYSNLRSALSSGDSGAANAAYRELVEHGVDEKTISSELTKLYNSGEATSILNLQMRGERLYTSNLKLKTDGEKHPDDFDSFIDAIVNGSGVSSEIRALLDKGYTVKQCMSAINGAFGNSSDRYRIMEKYNSADARILLNRILDAYEALGLDRGEEMAWIDANWIM